jgi:programmed cell death protein 5
MDSELEDIKKRRLEELKQSYERQSQKDNLEEAEAEKQLGAIEESVKARFTKEALERFGTLKLAHPEKAMQLIMAIAHAINQGKLTGMLGEDQMKEALKQLSVLSRNNRETKIVRK